MRKAKTSSIFAVVRVMSVKANSVVVVFMAWLYDSWSATETIISLIVIANELRFLTYSSVNVIMAQRPQLWFTTAGFVWNWPFNSRMRLIIVAGREIQAKRSSWSSTELVTHREHEKFCGKKWMKWRCLHFQPLLQEIFSRMRNSDTRANCSKTRSTLRTLFSRIFSLPPRVWVFKTCVASRKRPFWVKRSLWLGQKLIRRSVSEASRPTDTRIPSRSALAPK